MYKKRVRVLSGILRFYIRRKLRRGLEINIIPTYACNYNCSYCGRYQFEGKPTAKLQPIEEWKRILSNFDKTLRLDRFKIKTIIFNGGEPTLVPYFSELSNWILDQGWLLMVQTNLSKIEPLLEINQSTRLLIHACYHHENTLGFSFEERWRIVDKVHRVVGKELGDRKLVDPVRKTQLHPIIYWGEEETTGNITIDPNLNFYFTCEDHVKANL